MSAPEAQFRPIPLTIVDLIAILFPGNSSGGLYFL